MTTTSTFHAPAFSVMPDLGRNTLGHMSRGGWLRLAALTLLTAGLIAVLLMQPFASQNTHPTPEMLAQWEAMMSDG